MARKPREPRPSKKVYLFIVEGCTEENYIMVLKSLYRRDADIRNCNGGSAKNVMKKALDIISEHGDTYSGYVVWFGKDTFNETQDKNLREKLEQKKATQVYISEPCVENWLLAHFRKPLYSETPCNTCEKALNQHIPHYDKDDCPLLKKYIHIEQVNHAIRYNPKLGEIPQLFMTTT